MQCYFAAGQLAFSEKENMSRSEFLPILIILSCAIYFAWDLRWVCDDAFISFRYAKNLSEGSGLVYNPNEFVEGYTNFLLDFANESPSFWGMDVLLFSHISSIAFYILGCIGMLWSLKNIVSVGFFFMLGECLSCLCLCNKWT